MFQGKGKHDNELWWLWNSQKGCDHRQKKENHYENRASWKNCTQWQWYQIIGDFLDLVDEIEREVVDPDIRDVIKGIHQDIDELENYLSYE